MSGEGTTSTSNVKGRSSSGLRESSRKLELDKRIGLDMVVHARGAESVIWALATSEYEQGRSLYAIRMLSLRCLTILQIHIKFQPP